MKSQRPCSLIGNAFVFLGVLVWYWLVQRRDAVGANFSLDSKLEPGLDDRANSALETLKKWRWIAFFAIPIYFVVSIVLNLFVRDAEGALQITWIVIVVVLIISVFVFAIPAILLVREREIRKENGMGLDSLLTLAAVAIVYSDWALDDSSLGMVVVGGIIFMPIYFLIMHVSYIAVRYDSSFREGRLRRSVIQLYRSNFQMAIIGLSFSILVLFDQSGAKIDSHWFAVCYVVLTLLVFGLLIVRKNENESRYL